MGKHTGFIQFSPNVLEKSAPGQQLSEEQNAVLELNKASMVPDVAFGSSTNVGMVREHNEDSLFVAPPLFVVADGMGGHAAGEVASELAVQVISEQAPGYANATMLGKAVESANLAVYRAATENEQRKGMGTTVTAAMIKGTKLVIAQVGDSRAYLLHNGQLQQLTKDHSLMAELIESGKITPEEARYHPQRNYITRALGTGMTVRPDLYELKVAPGDRLLLCSDGLYTMVEDTDMVHTLSTVKDPQICALELVKQANAAGGHDNVTVIVVDIAGGKDAARAKAKKRSVLTAVFIGLVAIALILGAVLLIKSLTGAL